jgi:putative cardiolipin synthase
MDSHSEASEFHLLSDNARAFVARAALIKTARQSLDLQYYTIHNDASGHYLNHMLLEAADRGVMVRILVDDMNLSGRDRELKLFNLHPNITIKVFNPLTNREWFRNLELVIYQGRADRRMHNKVFIADKRIAIIGGRNLGDEYFDNRNNNNFVDLDLLTQGPLVREICQSFDHYWNSLWAVDISELAIMTVARKQLTTSKKRLKDLWRRVRNTPYFRSLHLRQFVYKLQQQRIYFLRAPAQLFYDLPEKITQHSDVVIDQLTLHLRPIVERATSEVVIASPYLVPGEDGVAWLSERISSGVNIRIITNSLSTTDVIAVHAGYRRYRPALLAAGVALFELKTTASSHLARARRLLQGLPRTSLHAKYLVVDRRWVYIGSANLDPRSRRLNTEIGVMIDSPELAAEVLTLFEQMTQPENSYRLSLHHNVLCWSSVEKGEQLQYHHEPQSGIWRRLLVRLIGLLPAEQLL